MFDYDALVDKMFYYIENFKLPRVKINKSRVKKILVITLSNIGDVILTFPVIDILREEFNTSRMSIVVGPQARGLFKGNPNFNRIYIYDKKQPIYETIPWIIELAQERFDLVVDLRNTAIPLFLFPKYKTSLFVEKNVNIHMKEKHLKHMDTIYPYTNQAKGKYSLYISDEDKNYISQLLVHKVGDDKKYIVVAPCTKNPSKRWSKNAYALTCNKLIQKYEVKIIFVGAERDSSFVEGIMSMIDKDSINLCGMTSLTQLAQLLRNCLLLICSDSASMHLGSYLDVPTLALFGPSRPQQYAPWSSKSKFIKKTNHVCAACQDKKVLRIHSCMNAITIEDVLTSFRIIDNEVEFI